MTDPQSRPRRRISGFRAALAAAGAFLMSATPAAAAEPAGGGPPRPPSQVGEGCAVATLPEPPLPPVAGDADFPASYRQSRDRFRADCAGLKAEGVGGCGPTVALKYSGDPDLTVDTAVASRDGNRNLLVLESGLHGVEAFAGAAVERRVMRERAAALLGRGFDLLLIHAINPYGFKHLRRVDACNIDLNRNFSRDGSLYADRRNPAYDKLKDLTENPQPVASVFWDSLTYTTRILLRWRGGFEWLGGMSTSDLAAGTHSGQYVNPAGLEFGGMHPAEQGGILDDLLADRIRSHTGRTYFLDLHTGLGPTNHLTIFSGRAWLDPAGSNGAGQGPLSFTQLDAFVRTLGTADISAVTATGDAFPTYGDVIDYVPGLAPKGTVIALTLEWGTAGDLTRAELETNLRMQLEHQAHFHGCGSPETCTEVRQNFVDLFNPQADPGERAAFRRAVLDQAWIFIDALTRAAPAFTDAR